MRGQLRNMSQEIAAVTPSTTNLQTERRAAGLEHTELREIRFTVLRRAMAGVYSSLIPAAGFLS